MNAEEKTKEKIRLIISNYRNGWGLLEADSELLFAYVEKQQKEIERLKESIVGYEKEMKRLKPITALLSGKGE